MPYYRAELKYLGDDVVLHPTGYYEAFDDDGVPVFVKNTDIFRMSNIKELSASKTVGGCILGAYSMVLAGYTGAGRSIYIYRINDRPSKDLSRVGMLDFPYTKEVRYKSAVKATYVGKYMINNKFKEAAKVFYRRFDMDDYEEFSDVEIEIWERFLKYINSLKINNLT